MAKTSPRRWLRERRWPITNRGERISPGEAVERLRRAGELAQRGLDFDAYSLPANAPIEALTFIKYRAIGLRRTG